MSDAEEPGAGDADLPPMIRFMGGNPQTYVDGTPHGAAVGMRVNHATREFVAIALPYDARLIGNPETRVLHGGAITVLLDQTCGLAVMCALDEVQSIATLDLRIDYMRAARPDEPVIAEARVIKKGRTIAFVTGIAHQGDAEDPVATAAGAFMIDRGDRR